MQLLTLSGLEPGELVQFRSATHVIDASAGADGSLIRMRPQRSGTAGGEAMLNPQPLPPEPPPEIEETRRRWPGIIDVITLPDSNGAVAVALRDDGTRLLLNRRLDGVMRIVGRFGGPIGRLTIVGGWAVASGRAGVQVLRRLH